MGIFQVNSSFENGINFNASVSYNQEFFNKKLKIDLAGYYYSDEKLGDIFSLNINAEYKIKERFKLYGSINFNQNNNQFGNNQYVYSQVSAQYTFAKSNKVVGKQYGNLNVFVFYDYNGNRLF